MSKPGLLPTPAEPKPNTVPATISFDQDVLEWLDEVADGTGRTRSDALREILRAVREQESKRS